MWELTKIPKIAHFYWGLNENLSFLRYLTIKSFIKYNPTWKVIIHNPLYSSKVAPTWNSDDQKGLKSNIDYYNDIKKFNIEIRQHDLKSYGFSNSVHEVHKTDFLRWKILSDYGGLWSDIDILYIDTIENLIENNRVNSHIDTLLCPYPNGIHSIGFLLSSVNNLFFKKAHEISKQIFDPSNYQSIGSEIFNNHFGNIARIKQLFPGLNPLFLDSICVYSLNCLNNDFLKLYSSNPIEYKKRGIIGYHWYAGSPHSKAIEHKLTERNYKDFNITLLYIIKEILE